MHFKSGILALLLFSLNAVYAAEPVHYVFYHSHISDIFSNHSHDHVSCADSVTGGYRSSPDAIHPECPFHTVRYHSPFLPAALKQVSTVSDCRSGIRIPEDQSGCSVLYSLYRARSPPFFSAV